MRIAIISDIHGNLPALKCVLDDIDKCSCDAVFSLGDICGYYSMINECINAVSERGIINILGNHDAYLLNGDKCPRSNSANICLDFQRRIITKDNISFLRKSKTSVNLSKHISMVHGGWNNPLDEYILQPNERYFKNLNGDFFFSGHTHIQCCYTFNKKKYCNPGSVGQPRDGDPRAAYCILDDDVFFKKRIPYDIDEIAFDMKKNGFDSYYYENLYIGQKIGDNKKRNILS
jgi:putative phosphoesterase